VKYCVLHASTTGSINMNKIFLHIAVFKKLFYGR